MKYQDRLKQLSDKAVPLEKSLVGFLVTHPEQSIFLQEIVKPEDLLSELGRVYQLVIDAHVSGKRVITLLQDSDIKISDILTGDFFPSSEIKRIAEEIREIGTAYKVIKLLGESVQKIEPATYKKFLPDFHSDFLRATARGEREAFEIEDMYKNYEKTQQEYSEKIIRGQKIIGMETGFGLLDEVIDGLRSEHLWVVGGYTSSGKTFFLLNIAASLIKQGKQIVFYSIEMSKNDVISRMLGILSGINGSKIMRGILTEQEARKVGEARELLLKSGLRIFSDKHNLSDITLSMIEENMRRPVDCYMLDYLQLVTTSGKDSEYDSMRRAAKSFQETTKRVKAPMILLSQVSNEGAKNPEGAIMSFKGAGDIAAAADLAMHLHSGETNHTEMQAKMGRGEPVNITCAIKKNRHGRTGNLDLEFNSKTGIFNEWNV